MSALAPMDGHPRASRHRCAIEREELALRGHGGIAFGRPCEQATDVLEYWCDVLTDSGGAPRVR